MSSSSSDKRRRKELVSFFENLRIHGSNMTMRNYDIITGESSKRLTEIFGCDWKTMISAFNHYDKKGELSEDISRLLGLNKRMSVGQVSGYVGSHTASRCFEMVKEFSSIVCRSKEIMERLASRRHQLEIMMQDSLHAIEFLDMDEEESFKVMEELKSIRAERRNIKDALLVAEPLNRFIESNSAVFDRVDRVVTQTREKNDQVEKQKYSTRTDSYAASLFKIKPCERYTIIEEEYPDGK